MIFPKHIKVLVLAGLFSTAVSGQDEYVDYNQDADNGFGSSRSGTEFSYVGSSEILRSRNGRGRIAFDSPATRVVSALPFSALNSEASVTVSVNNLVSDGFAEVGPFLRQDGTTGNNDSRYVAFASFGADRIVLRLRKVVSGGTIRLQQRLLPYAAKSRERFIIKLRAVGSSPTALYAKIWPESSSEPTGWLVSAIDDEPVLQRPNRFAGIFSQSTPEYVGNVRVRLDNFLLSSLEPDVDVPTNDGSSGNFNTNVIFDESNQTRSAPVDVTYDLAQLNGAARFMRFTATCTALGGDAFATASASISDNTGNVLYSLQTCLTAGVSNGESTGASDDSIIPIPDGAATLTVSLRLTRLSQPGTTNSNVVQRIRIYGNDVTN
jgi:hypothetical protein